MLSNSQIPIASKLASRRFATRLAWFYGAEFTLIGCHMPFFPVWMKAVGLDASWIGIIAAVPSVARFTVLPFVTSLAERHGVLRGAMMVTAGVTMLGFATIGTQHLPLAIFLAYALTAASWTPMVPLTDAYALWGVVRYGLNYGPMRLWGSAAFVVGALGCGLVADRIEPTQLIWIIAATAALGAAVSLGLQPVEGHKAPATAPHSASAHFPKFVLRLRTHLREPRKVMGTSKPVDSGAAPPFEVSEQNLPLGVQELQRGGTGALLRDRGLLTILAASALIQGSHSVYYVFGSISWQMSGLGGLTIAALWALGVVAEIVVFAWSPRFILKPATLIVIGGLGAVARWLITAQDPPVAVLAAVQLAHGLSFGLTQVGTMILMVHHVPVSAITRAQGYLAASGGIVASGASMVSGVIFARYGQGAYYAMAGMALLGAALMWSARRRLQPHSAASGG